MATEQTYLSVIHDAFAAAATAVNEQLVDRGLAPLKSWLTGEPTEFRQSDTPYGCWDFENLAEIGERRDELNVEDFQIDVIVTLALAGKDRSDLTRQIATVPPNVIAALECLPGSDLPYRSRRATGWRSCWTGAARPGVTRVRFMCWIFLLKIRFRAGGRA